MKIAYVCNEYPPTPHGGIGTAVQALARGLAQRGHQVTVVGLGERDSERSDRGVRVVTLRTTHLRGASWLIDRWRLHRWLRHEVLAGRLDIIEVPDYHGMLPFRSVRCPAVVRLHHSETDIARLSGAKPPLRTYWCEKRTLQKHPQWVGHSKHILELTKAAFGIKPARYETVCPAIAEEEDATESIGAVLPGEFILFVGRVCSGKGAFILAEAARPLLESMRELHLVYIGKVIREGKTLASDRIRRILGDKLAQRVLFMGWLPRGATMVAMRRARELALPSTLESFGLVAAEAMVVGCPVVVNDSGPFNEFVIHGETGLLVRPGDVGALKDAMETLIKDRQLASRLAGNAKEFARERFSLKKACEESLRFYNSVLEEDVRA